MNIKIIHLFHLLLLLLKIIILRAGLVMSIIVDEVDVEIANNKHNNNITNHHKSSISKGKPTVTIKTITSTFTVSPSPSTTLYSSIVPPDKCAESGTIKDCTFEKPYCFVDGNNINCDDTNRLGWRISPLDGLILNNGQRPNPNCELFIPPTNPEINDIIMTLLNDSDFGSRFKDFKSAWFNIFEDLGNCPFKSQFCDKDTSTCKDLLGSGKNCTSSNQCFSRYCEKLDQSAPDDTTQRICVEANDTAESKRKELSSLERDKFLPIIISISVLATILMLGVIIWLIKAQRKKLLNIRNSFDPLLPSNSGGMVSPINSSPISRTSTRRSSQSTKSNSSDNFSILLPPPPTISRDSLDFHNNNNNNNNNNNHYNHYNTSTMNGIYIYPSNQYI